MKFGGSSVADRAQIEKVLAIVRARASEGRVVVVSSAHKGVTDALVGADLFLGLSRGGLVNADMVKAMADKPIIFALANPDPEIGYAEAKEACPDSIVATGRSDFNNQVNNVLGFPFIFRGALDVRATHINEPMKIAAARAIAELTRRDVPQVVMNAYGEDFNFGPEYIIPSPFDPRLLVKISTAVAKIIQAAKHTAKAAVIL